MPISVERSVTCLAVLVVLGASAPALAAPASPTPAFTPSLAYTAAPFVVFGGDRADAASYTHEVTGGGTYAIDKQWSATVQGAWTAGASVSEKSVGDIAGVQGVFNNGDEAWLYQALVTGTFSKGSITLGRMSSGDYFGALPVMGQFVNSAFSSNGGAISVNDPGRAENPASSWGVTGTLAPNSAVTLKGGLFLSSPDLFNDGFDFSFRPGDGVLAFGEADITVAPGWTVGAGVWSDSARFTTFAGRAVDGNWGYYGFVDGALIPGVKASDPPKLEGFLMLQGAPREDRSLQPFFALGGLVFNGPFAKRPADSVSLGFQTGSLSEFAGGGHETTFEANYLWTINGRWGLRPDVQYIIGPAGRDSDAWAVGLQIEFSL